MAAATQEQLDAIQDAINHHRKVTRKVNNILSILAKFKAEVTFEPEWEAAAADYDIVKTAMTPLWTSARDDLETEWAALKAMVTAF